MVARIGDIDFGSLRTVAPISAHWGFDRGLPIDRHYIEGFLARHASDVRGQVLEIADNSYTRRFGGQRVTASHVLDVRADNTAATLVADITYASAVPSHSFDCIIFTQVLQLLFDTQQVIATLYRLLRPGGVLLATFPGITRIEPDADAYAWYWTFTSFGAKRLFGTVFGADAVEVTTHGNVLAATAFLHGIACSELTVPEIEARDPRYEVLITVRARKRERG